MAWPLEPDRTEMERLGAEALAWLSDFVEARATAPSHVPEEAAEVAREMLASRPGEGPGQLPALLERFGRAAEKGYDTAGPGYLAYIPGGGVFAAALADMLAAGVNRYVTMAAPAPGLAALEASVGAWLCEQFGFPAEAQGILTTGGSMANFSGLLTARHDRLGDDLAGGVLYVSEHTHHSNAKAARLAGMPAAAIRRVRTDERLRIDPAALREAVRSDRAAGLRPFLVVASAGTTSTGAVDPLGEIADVAQETGVWLHVDAAYGGFFGLTDRGRAAFAGIERADSITLDPHKGLFLPYGSGCLLVRDGESLRRAHSLEAHYLQDLDRTLGVPDFSEYSPELSRGFRGLRVWLPLHLHGVGAFRAALDEKLDLARRFHDAISGIPEVEVLGEPELSIVAFRLRDGDDDDNRRLQDSINAARRVFLSSTLLDGRFTLRVCVLSHRTHADRIDEAVELVREAVREG